MEWLLRMIFSAFSRVFPLQTAVFPFLSTHIQVYHCI
jgi:hypothetical protein